MRFLVVADDTGIRIGYKEILIGLGILVGIIIVFLIVRGIIRSIRRKIRSLSSFINAAAYSAATKGIEKLDAYEKSKVTPTSQKAEVRVALREQSPVCPQCGAPNTSIEEFCKYCGASLIKKEKL